MVVLLLPHAQPIESALPVLHFQKQRVLSKFAAFESSQFPEVHCHGCNNEHLLSVIAERGKNRIEGPLWYSAPDIPRGYVHQCAEDLSK